MRKVIGTLLRPDQSPVTPAQLVFRAVTTSLSGVPQGADAKAMLSESGAYDVDLVEGTYAVTLFTATAPGALGTVIVTDGPDITLPELLQVQAIPYSIAADLLDRVIELENVPPGSGLAGVDPGAGIGVTNPIAGRALVANTDRGSTALATHVAADDPHPGKYPTSAAVTAAVAAVAADLTAHAGTTEGAHGLPNPASLVVTTDPRMANARAPTAHAATHHAGGGEPISPTAIGAATTGALLAVADAQDDTAAALIELADHVDDQDAAMAAHVADTTGVHGIANTALLVRSSTPLIVEPVTEYPDPQVPGTLYILLPP